MRIASVTPYSVSAAYARVSGLRSIKPGDSGNLPGLWCLADNGLLVDPWMRRYGPVRSYAAWILTKKKWRRRGSTGVNNRVRSGDRSLWGFFASCLTRVGQDCGKSLLPSRGTVLSKGDMMHEPLDVPCEQEAEMDDMLAERYLRALTASTDGAGRINFDWLVMHIWLARVDAVQSAYAGGECFRLAGENGSRTFGIRLDRMHASVERVLPRVLPLMADFVEVEEIRRWREEGGAERVAKDPGLSAFRQKHRIAISSPDIVYALGRNGPAGDSVFRATESRVRTAMLS